MYTGCAVWRVINGPITSRRCRLANQGAPQATVVVFNLLCHYEFWDCLTHVIDSVESCLELWIVVELIMCIIKFMTLLNKTSKENWKEINEQAKLFGSHIILVNFSSHLSLRLRPYTYWRACFFCRFVVTHVTHNIIVN